MTAFYQHQTRRIAKETSAAVVALWRHGLPRKAFVDVAATVVAQKSAEAWTLADAAATVAVGRKSRTLIPFIGLPPDVSHSKLADGLDTLLARQDERGLDLADFHTTTESHLERFAASETLRAGRTGYLKTLGEHKGVIGWQRVLSPNACELCTSWADDGVFPVDVEMLDHANCSCSAEPVFASEGDTSE